MNALVPLEPPLSLNAAWSSARASATFLAHLIATREQAPQTCARRRASPDEAILRYTAVRDSV